MNPAILSVGALTAVGLSAEQTAFGLRAGIFCPRTIGYRDAAGEELGAVLVPSIHEEIEGWERLVSLALPPLREVLRHVGAFARVSRVFLALPAARPGLSASEQACVIDELADAALDGDRAMLFMVAGDREAFAAALQRATAYLGEHRDEVVVVGAVDSFHDARTYRALDEDHRILSERAPNGFIPGEGSAFVALGAATSRFPALSYPSFVEAGSEPDDDDALAEAWTEIVRRAASCARRTLESRGEALGAPWLLVDQCTERHRNKAWQTVNYRLGDELDPGSSVIETLAERLGDAGAASGAILAVYASIGFASGFAPGKSAVIALASDGAARAGLSLVAATSGAAAGRAPASRRDGRLDL